MKEERRKKMKVISPIIEDQSPVMRETAFGRQLSAGSLGVNQQIQLRVALPELEDVTA